jgi:hypothetical protein
VFGSVSFRWSDHYEDYYSNEAKIAEYVKCSVHTTFLSKNSFNDLSVSL